jgi:hypothetical protein
MKTRLMILLATAALSLLPGCSPGEKYTGELKNGLPHGRGILVYPGGAHYGGQFEEGLKEGFGTWYHPQGILYLGRWHRDRYDQVGMMIIQDGTKYTGAWKDGQKSGHGFHSWPDGRFYIGQWEDNAMHGYGMLIYPDGSRYLGQWENDRKHGLGLLIHPDGTFQYGIWQQNAYQGIPVEGITLDYSTLTLYALGPPFTLTATLQPDHATNKNLTWSSSDSTVARVAGGAVTPLKEGTAVITAVTEDGGFEAACHVTVRPQRIPVAGILISQSTLKLEVGMTRILTATILPYNATNHVVTWSSENPAIATVGAYGLVTGQSEGQTAITVRSLDGGWTAACIVTVAAAETPEEPPIIED